MRPRYRHLLVPLDFSRKNRRAVDAALELAQGSGTRVTLLHVIEPIEAVAEDRDIQEFMNQLAGRARQELERFSEPFIAAGQAVECRVRMGPRIPEIVDFAAEQGADLIVLSSHPLDQTQPAKSLTTVSYQVGLAADCSVLLVKESMAESNESQPTTVEVT